ncbi:hypothetical protein FIBSPDRAFT_990558, partial [Athelia psychrophila]
LNLKLRLGKLLEKLTDYKAFVMAVATMDIKRLQQLVRAALNRNVSIKKLLRIMQDAVDGLYSARGYGSDDVDLVAIIHSIGGSKLLYAMSHAAGLPSLRTLKRHRQLVSLRPCIASIREKDIDHNLNALFSNSDMAGRALTGHSLLIDEISLEERLRYFPPLKGDTESGEIAGLCREHAHKAELKIIDVESVDRLADQLDDEVCHIGREATVAAVASFGADDYHARPVILSPTCKTEKAPEQASWIRMLLERWHILYEELRGPIWSVATDGDATRRSALHSILMSETLSPSDALYDILGDLPGLNLQTGKNKVTSDSDLKHIAKRLASLIRSGGGIALRDLLLDKNYLAQHLLRIPGTSVESVALLIDPSDHQDVPKAVRLLEAIISLAELPTTDLNPTDMKANRLLTLLGVMLHSLITPSTNVNLNLQEQMTRLATYAHLSFAMFRLHGTSFSSNQLYADCQAMIKNAFFCVAKQQLLDPERPFYLMQGGDDRLEGNFCETRVDSKHQPNVDIVQLTYKEAAAMDRREIFDRHPDWDRGHRRLKFYNDTAVDHVNPRSWKGNVTCGLVNLKHAWTDGRKVAESALDTAKINDINFNTIFVTGGLDMLQPQHRGIFPAVATDKDRSIPDEFLE